MARGIPTDPKARERQLENLAKGRAKAAANALKGNPTATPATKPGSQGKHSQATRGNTGDDVVTYPSDPKGTPATKPATKPGSKGKRAPASRRPGQPTATRPREKTDRGGQRSKGFLDGLLGRW